MRAEKHNLGLITAQCVLNSAKYTLPAHFHWTLQGQVIDLDDTPNRNPRLNPGLNHKITSESSGHEDMQ